MPLQKQEVTTYKWVLRVFRPSAVGNSVTERTLDIDESKTFTETSTGVFFNPPTGYVFDAETLRAIADHLEAVNKDFVAKTVEEEKSAGKKKAKTSFTLGH